MNNSRSENIFGPEVVLQIFPLEYRKPLINRAPLTVSSLRCASTVRDPLGRPEVLHTGHYSRFQPSKQFSIIFNEEKISNS